MQDSYTTTPEVNARKQSAVKVQSRAEAMFAIFVSLTIICATKSHAQQGHNTSRTMSVCELFSNLPSHSSTRVKVRGILYAGREVFALGEKTCTKKFVTRYRLGPDLPGISEPTREYVWPTAIDLTGSSGSPKEGGINTDEEAVRRVINMLTQARAAQRDKNTNVDLWVTVTGLLAVKDHDDVAPDTHGVLLASGYGHQGTYPAQLVIETMTDPEIKLTKD